MVSDKNNLPDDDIFDDIDFDASEDALDNAPDALEESWDETTDGDTNNDKSSASKKTKKLPKSGKKSSKGLLAIIGIAAAGALGLVVVGSGALTSSPSTAPVAEGDVASQTALQESAPTEVTDASIPPMPAPMAADTAPTETGTTDIPAAETTPDIAPMDSALTPMPGAQDLAASDASQALPDLQIAETPAALEAAPMLADEPVAAETSLDLAVPSSQTPPDQMTSDVSVSETLPVETPAPQPLSESIETPQDNLQATSVQTPSQTITDSSALTERITGLEREMALLQKSYETNLADSNAKLETALATIQSLQDKINTLNSQPTQTKDTAPQAPQTKQVLENITPPAPPPAPVLRTETPERPEQKIQQTTSWMLRSARTDSAVVSARGSNELRNVEVGDSLPGIGKIQSIGLENGSWVVRGTRGSISR